MRLIVLKSDSLQALTRQLAATPGNAGAATETTSPLDRLKRLNPHVDFANLTAGTALFLPETPDLETVDSQGLDSGAFDALASDIATGLKAATVRARAGVEAQSGDRSDVAAAVKTAAVKRLMDSDPTLKLQIDDATAQFAKDQQNGQDLIKQVDAMQKDAAGEMAALAKLFG